MKTPRHVELVGILVGSIVQSSRPLIFKCYLHPNDTTHTRVSESEEDCSAKDLADKLAEQFGSIVRAIYKNDFDPPWYYVQFYAGANPSWLIKWGVPWTATRVWTITRRRI